MVAYSFKPGFIPPIRALEKRQTIRLPRKRHARAGEALQFFTGPRMKPVRIGGAVCVAVRDVRLDFETNRVDLDDVAFADTLEALDAFAIRDGFALPPGAGGSPWEYLRRWWGVTHPGKTIFRGVLVDWGDSFKAARDD